jgi:hypothetical protein
MTDSQQPWPESDEPGLDAGCVTDLEPANKHAKQAYVRSRFRVRETNRLCTPALAFIAALAGASVLASAASAAPARLLSINCQGSLHGPLFSVAGHSAHFYGVEV